MKRGNRPPEDSVFLISQLDKKLTSRFSVSSSIDSNVTCGIRCNQQDEKRVVSVARMMRDISQAVLDRPFVRYATAVVVLAASFFLRYFLVQGLGLSLPPFVTFYPAIMLVAFLAGLWSGLLATALVALAADYFFLPPFGFGIASMSDVVALALFALMGIFMSLVAEGYRRSLLSIAAYKVEQALWVSNKNWMWHWPA